MWVYFYFYADLLICSVFFLALFSGSGDFLFGSNMSLALLSGRTMDLSRLTTLNNLITSNCPIAWFFFFANFDQIIWLVIDYNIGCNAKIHREDSQHDESRKAVWDSRRSNNYVSGWKIILLDIGYGYFIVFVLIVI